jgi:hypothetical protein
VGAAFFLLGPVSGTISAVGESTTTSLTQSYFDFRVISVFVQGRF